MKIKFTKMHGAGNDYIYINATKYDIKDPSALAVRMSDRHFGIGGDGIIYIRRSKRGLYMMDLYNVDGSRATMCGNGVRCVGKYLYDHKMVSKERIPVDTLAGVKILDLKIEDGKCVGATVDMGVPEIGEDLTVNFFGEDYNGRKISVGNPHFVIVTDPDNCTKVGPVIEWSEYFPNGVNTEFVRIDGEKDVTMRVWERGSGETFACGTGCTAVMAALKSQGLIKGSTLNVHCLGGVITIDWEGEGHNAYMTGPAETVYEGEFEI